MEELMTEATIITGVDRHTNDENSFAWSQQSLSPPYRRQSCSPTGSSAIDSTKTMGDSEQRAARQGLHEMQQFNRRSPIDQSNSDIESGGGNYDDIDEWAKLR